MVEGSIGSLHQLHFIIDTGADPTLVDRRVARAVGPSENPGRMALFNKTIEVQQVVLPSLEVGPIRIKDLRALARDLSRLEEALQVRVDGVIGLEVLGRSSFTIAYDSSTIIFGAPDGSFSEIPLESGPPFATTFAEVEHHPVRLLIDTGAASLSLFAGRVHDVLPMTSGLGSATAANLGGDFQRQRILLSSVRLGKKEVGPQEAFLLDEQQDSGRDFDGFVSPPAVGMTRVIFDLQRCRLGWRR